MWQILEVSNHPYPSSGSGEVDSVDLHTAMSRREACGSFAHPLRVRAPETTKVVKPTDGTKGCAHAPPVSRRLAATVATPRDVDGYDVAFSRWARCCRTEVVEIPAQRHRPAACTYTRQTGVVQQVKGRSASRRAVEVEQCGAAQPTSEAITTRSRAHVHRLNSDRMQPRGRIKCSRGGRASSSPVRGEQRGAHLCG